jgi:hypothetical protein
MIQPKNSAAVDIRSEGYLVFKVALMLIAVYRWLCCKISRQIDRDVGWLFGDERRRTGTGQWR